MFSLSIKDQLLDLIGGLGPGGLDSSDLLIKGSVTSGYP